MSSERYCFSEIGDHSIICGDAKLFGSISAAFLIKEGQTTITDWTSSSEWEAAVADGSVIVIKEINANYPQPSETTVPSGIGGQADVLASFTHQLLWRDRAVNATNDTFYADLNQFTSGGIGWFEPKNNTLKVVENEDVTFLAKLEVLEDSKSIQSYNITSSWDTIDMPKTYDAPTNYVEIFIFNYF